MRGSLFFYVSGFVVIPFDCDTVPEELFFNFYNYDHLGSMRIKYHGACFNDTLSIGFVNIQDYYPFGKALATFDYTNPNKYSFSNKEFDQENGYNYFGARYYNSNIGRFMSVDPLADSPDNIGFSPYHYVWNNPIKFIDPDGRHGENTIYTDQDGNELGRTVDNLDNAIVVVSNVGQFNEIMGGNLSGDEKASALRGTGKNYMVDGMIDLLETSISDKANMNEIPHSDYQLVDSQGNLRTDISSEWGGYLTESGGNVSCSDCTFSDHNPYLVSGSTYSRNRPPENTVGTIHTHPLSGLSFMTGSGGSISFPSHPSGQDMRMHRSSAKGGFMNAVIDRTNIFLHNGSSTISVNHSFFR